MIATLTSIEWRERENGLPYGVMKAVATQGDTNASALDEDGFLNPLACMSRTFNLTKTIFPGSAEQVAAAQESYVEGIKMRLGLFQVPMGVRFNIINSDGEYITEEREVQKIAEKDSFVAGKARKKGDVYSITEDVPKVYESISLVLFVDKAGNSIENDGEPVEAIALRNFESGKSKGTYIVVD